MRSRKLSNLKVALVHDYLIREGGAERVLKVLSEMFPLAPIFTLFYDQNITSMLFPERPIFASFLQKFPHFIKEKRRYLVSFFPKIVESFDFKGFDLVISSNTAFAHGIITPLSATHLCYCHSPMRYAWDWYHEYKKEQNVGFLRKMMISYLTHSLRIWDKIAADRPDLYIANSKNIQKRLNKYYRTNSRVIYPPVNIKRFKVNHNVDNYFLIVSTLTPYKKVDLAIELFNKIGKKLVIIGDGPQRRYLEQIAGKNIEFLGFKHDQDVVNYMENCRALIFPGEDDFGITPVEALACGRPVLAYGKGGALETVTAGRTGEFFYEQNVSAIEDGLARLISNEKQYNPGFLRKQAEKFSEERFVGEVMELIEGL